MSKYRAGMDDLVSDEVIGFHCQQAAEKILKALLSDLEVRFRKTHEIGALMALLAQAGCPAPENLENLDILTPFGAIYRYEDFDIPVALDRVAARQATRELPVWVEAKLLERSPKPGE
jgi:HEPN domain-containing protein